MKKKSHLQQPIMVSSHDLHLDGDYAEWIAEVKHRYRSAQVKAAVKVNVENCCSTGCWGETLCKRRLKNDGGAA